MNNPTEIVFFGLAFFVVASLVMWSLTRLAWMIILYPLRLAWFILRIPLRILS